MEANGKASAGEAYSHAAALHEVDNSDDRRGKTRGGADGQRPARAEPCRRPSRRLARRWACRPRLWQGESPSRAHAWRVGGYLHQAVRGGGEGLRGHADDDSATAEEPVVGRDRGQRAAEPEDCRTGKQQREARFLPAGGKERAGDRSDRHGRCQEPVLARAGMKDRDGHGGNEDREVEPKGPDQKKHEKDGFQVRPFPDIAEPFGKASASSGRPVRPMKFTDAKETQRAEHGDKRGRVDQEYPPGPHGGDEDTGDGGTDHPCGVERCGIQRHRVRQVGFPDQFRDKCLARR